MMCFSIPLAAIFLYNVSNKLNCNFPFSYKLALIVGSMIAKRSMFCMIILFFKNSATLISTNSVLKDV